MAKSNKESRSGPDPNRWYNLSLGNSYKRHNPSSKFCTLRYQFKPASIDKNQPGSLHKTKENRVTVEFQNNQQGKSEVTFEGTSGDYNENDAVLFFDGETFRLERLHRAVKRLRHVRPLSESLAAAAPSAATSLGPAVQTNSPPVEKGAKLPSLNKPAPHQILDGVEKIDTGDPERVVSKPEDENIINDLSSQPNLSQDSKSFELEEEIDIMNDDDNDGSGPAEQGNVSGKGFDTGIDINIPQPNDTDDEIADVDVSNDEADKGPSAAEALRAQVQAEGGNEQTSSSSASSGSESSGSGSESSSRSGSGTGSDSSSSDSESSDNVSVNSI